MGKKNHLVIIFLKAKNQKNFVDAKKITHNVGNTVAPCPVNGSF